METGEEGFNDFRKAMGLPPKQREGAFRWKMSKCGQEPRKSEVMASVHV